MGHPPRAGHVELSIRGARRALRGPAPRGAGRAHRVQRDRLRRGADRAGPTAGRRRRGGRAGCTRPAFAGPRGAGDAGQWLDRDDRGRAAPGAPGRRRPPRRGARRRSLRRGSQRRRRGGPGRRLGPRRRGWTSQRSWSPWPPPKAPPPARWRDRAALVSRPALPPPRSAPSWRRSSERAAKTGPCSVGPCGRPWCRGESPVREEVSAWLAGARPGALAAVSLALAGTGRRRGSGLRCARERPRQAPSSPTDGATWPPWREGRRRTPRSPSGSPAWPGDAEEWMLRAAAIRALAAAAVPDATRVAREGLSDAYPRVRIAAVDALVGHEGSLEQLVGIARRDPWPMVRASAVQSLGPVGGARPLVRAGRSRSPRERPGPPRSAPSPPPATGAHGRRSRTGWCSPGSGRRCSTPGSPTPGHGARKTRWTRWARSSTGPSVPTPGSQTWRSRQRRWRRWRRSGVRKPGSGSAGADSDLSPSMIRIAAQAAERVQSCR